MSIAVKVYFPATDSLMLTRHFIFYLKYCYNLVSLLAVSGCLFDLSLSVIFYVSTDLEPTRTCSQCQEKHWFSISLPSHCALLTEPVMWHWARTLCFDWQTASLSWAILKIPGRCCSWCFDPFSWWSIKHNLHSVQDIVRVHSREVTKPSGNIKSV